MHRTQAKDRGKPKAYIAYKQAKCDFTANMIKTAQIVQNLQKSGFLRAPPIVPWAPTTDLHSS